MEIRPIRTEADHSAALERIGELMGAEASEILNRRRPLTLDQIRRISSAWQIPADSLINEYKVARGS